MTYGLSRDDAGRFMRDYVNRGVFPEDPFHSLDLEGVGELLLIAAKRGRARNPGLVLGSAASTAATPPRCASARWRASTTSPARPSASRSRGWRPRRPRSSPTDGKNRTRLSPRRDTPRPDRSNRNRPGR